MLGKRPNAKLAKFYRSLPPEFERFARRGTTLVIQPVDHVLCGFSFEPHGGTPSDQRWVHWFVQLLTDPSDFLSLGFGWRIPNAKQHTPMPLYERSWGRTPQDTIEVMRNEGLPALARYGTLRGLYDLSLDFSVDLLMGHYWRYWTACLAGVLLNKPDGVIRSHLEQVRLCIPQEPRSFEQLLLEHCDQLERALDAEDHTVALALMRSWEAWSVTQLAIEDIYDDSAWAPLLGRIDPREE